MDTLSFQQSSKFRYLIEATFGTSGVPIGRVGECCQVLGFTLSGHSVEEFQNFLLAMVFPHELNPKRVREILITCSQLEDSISESAVIPTDVIISGIAIEEEISSKRLEIIQDYISRILKATSDDARHKAISQVHPTIIGDKQAGRLLGVELHDQRHPESVRLGMAIAIGLVGEKPRIATGIQTEDQKTLKKYDIPSLAALIHILKLSKTPSYLDKRTFRNRETHDAVSTTQVQGLIEDFYQWERDSAAKNQIPLFTDAIPPNASEKEKAYYQEFRQPVHELCDAVRIAAVQSLALIGDCEEESVLKTLLHSMRYDPGWAVRCAAADVLCSFGKEIRKFGMAKRLGQVHRWYQEVYPPRRSGLEALSNFWNVNRICCKDPAWQVRTRIITNIVQCVDFGNFEIYDLIASQLEDTSFKARRVALNALTAAALGQGRLVAERNRRKAEHIQAGMSTADAIAKAELETAETMDSDFVAVDVLIGRCRNSDATTRRTAIMALSTVLCGARLEGHRAATAAFIQGCDDEDLLVARAAIQALAKTCLPGDSGPITRLLTVVASSSDASCRKSAIDAVARIAVPGDGYVTDKLMQATTDKDASVREASLRALQTVSAEDDEGAATAVTNKLRDPEWFVRRAAAKALTMMDPEGRTERISEKIWTAEDKAWFDDAKSMLQIQLASELD